MHPFFTCLCLSPTGDTKKRSIDYSPNSAHTHAIMLRVASFRFDCWTNHANISRRAGFRAYARLHSSMVGVDPETHRKYKLREDDLLQCFEIYGVLKEEQDVGRYLAYVRVPGEHVIDTNPIPPRGTQYGEYVSHNEASTPPTASFPASYKRRICWVREWNWTRHP